MTTACPEGCFASMKPGARREEATREAERERRKSKPRHHFQEQASLFWPARLGPGRNLTPSQSLGSALQRPRWAQHMQLASRGGRGRTREARPAKGRGTAPGKWRGWTAGGMLLGLPAARAAAATLATPPGPAGITEGQRRTTQTLS